MMSLALLTGCGEECEDLLSASDPRCQCIAMGVTADQGQAFSECVCEMDPNFDRRCIELEITKLFTQDASTQCDSDSSTCP